MSECPATLAVDLHPGDRLVLGGPASVQFFHKTGRSARVAVTADRNVEIRRISADIVDEPVTSMAQSVSS